jgi:hypothetical protein
MPRKPKPRNPVASPDEVWIAPRPANASKARTFEPAGAARSNRYLDFADIALGSKTPSPRKKKAKSTVTSTEPNHAHHGKVTPIDRHRMLNQGFGAFRNSR